MADGWPPREQLIVFRGGRWVGRSVEAKIRTRSSAAGYFCRDTAGRKSTARDCCICGQARVDATKPDPAVGGSLAIACALVSVARRRQEQVDCGLMLPRDYQRENGCLCHTSVHYFPEVFLPDGPHSTRTPPRRWSRVGWRYCKSRLLVRDRPPPQTRVQYSCAGLERQ